MGLEYRHCSKHGRTVHTTYSVCDKCTPEERGVAALQPTNTGSPKLPLQRFEVYKKLGCPISENEGEATRGYREIVDTVYDLLERQPQAGA